MYLRMSDQIRQFAFVNCRGIMECPTFGRLGFLCKRCFHGSVHMFLFWGCLCIAYLCNTSLAATDSELFQLMVNHLTSIDVGQNGIMLSGAQNVNIRGSLTHVEDDVDDMSSILLGFLRGQPSYISSSGNTYDNFLTGGRDGATLTSPMGSGPNNGLSMLQILGIIGRFTGGVTTNGYWNYNNLSLPELILGWNVNKLNPHIFDNGLLGHQITTTNLLNEIAGTANQIDWSINNQTSALTNQTEILARKLDNLTYLNSTMYPLFTNVSALVGYLEGHELEPRLNAANLSIPYYLPYFLCPEDTEGNYVDDYLSLYTIDYIPQVAHNIDVDALRQWFKLNYGNVNTLEEALQGQNLDDASEVNYGVATVTNKYAQESEDVEFDLDNDLASILTGPWSQANNQLNSVKHDTHIENSINNFKYLLRDSLVDEQETGGFGFSINFDTGDGSGAATEFETDTLFADANFLVRVKSQLDQYLDYIAWIVKGGMILMLGWRSATTAMNVIGDGSI